ncbi:Ferritin-like metal-binding protein YciE [Natronoarchaeum philippinense]|uniref:Ferritin-like metal-binding protein YciE n=1 Tax=Natronoarchaeum philippinense TaxID=558529 RepID=A0A285N488_NATPI|nr:DUF892 family protein [Natronoarchaeum philippinense]SNZ04272.1 Ferritin-like metal-binding protein YciE [Natronoarchaeum philippinense]
MNDIETLEALFEHELATLYYVETELIDVLDEVTLEFRDDDLTEAFADHRDETREHARRLESVFRAVGASSRSERSSALDGVVADRQRVVEATDDPDLVDARSLAAGIEIEAIEVERYESLLRLAEELDYDDDVTEPLAENRDEDAAAKKALTAKADGSKLRKLLGKLR